MEAKELRIGNLVYDNLGGILKIKGINTDSDLSHLKPIPLTEEWLIEFGFEEVSNEWFLDGFNFHLYLSKTGLVIRGLVIFSKNVSNLKINYVHQLQNLYYALTNEELKINAL